MERLGRIEATLHTLIAQKAARIVRERRTEFADAVEEVLAQRSVTDQERTMLIQKAQSIVFLGLEDE